jgi:hypothetical protein
MPEEKRHNVAPRKLHRNYQKYVSRILSFQIRYNFATIKCFNFYRHIAVYRPVARQLPLKETTRQQPLLCNSAVNKPRR